MCIRPLILCSLLGSATAALAADGLRVAPDDAVWPQWQARLTVSTTQLDRVSLTGEPGAGRNSLQSAQLLGDYYFLRASDFGIAAALGGLRATGGLLYGSPGSLPGPSLPGQPFSVAMQPALGDAAASGLATVPYIGLGYSAGYAHGSVSVSADFGLVAESPGSITRAGRVLLGTQGLDGMLRELRLSPVLKLGMRYSF